VTSSCLIKDVDWASLHFFQRRRTLFKTNGNNTPFVDQWDSFIASSVEETTTVPAEDNENTSAGRGTFSLGVSSEEPWALVHDNDVAGDEFGGGDSEEDYKILMDELESKDSSLIPCPNGWDYAEEGSSTTTNKLHTSIVIDV
jgi:hypothetical protein